MFFWHLGPGGGVLIADDPWDEVAGDVQSERVRLRERGRERDLTPFRLLSVFPPKGREILESVYVLACAWASKMFRCGSRQPEKGAIFRIARETKRNAAIYPLYWRTFPVVSRSVV
jgi:hypothetical protein